MISIKTFISILALFAGFGIFTVNARAAEPTSIDIVLNCKTKCVDTETVFNLPIELTKLQSKAVPTSPARNGLFESFDPKPQTNSISEVNLNGIYKWTKTLQAKFNPEPISAAIEIKEGRATTFTPPHPGLIIDLFSVTDQIASAVTSKKDKVTVQLITINPVGELKDLNDLGITELVGIGKSSFNGSPKNRRFNIQKGMEKIKGIILKPGEVFSFNENICPVEADSGFLPELVIKADGTKPEFGGGLCQVSSTIYRAAMNAGLEIVQRKNHSYAVQYYAPQGSDATTYCGGIDFKFKNDFAYPILIWPYLKDSNNLVFELWGTGDNRTVELPKPVVFDRKPDGSMKAYWKRTVTKNGESKSEQFDSVYLSPALFHKVEEKKPTTPTTPEPTTTPTSPNPSTNTIPPTTSPNSTPTPAT